MKTTTNASKIQKFSRKVREESVEPYKPKRFSKNIIYDRFNDLSKPMGAIDIEIIWFKIRFKKEIKLQ